jgi:hypothetical protein
LFFVGQVSWKWLERFWCRIKWHCPVFIILFLRLPGVTLKVKCYSPYSLAFGWGTLSSSSPFSLVLGTIWPQPQRWKKYISFCQPVLMRRNCLPKRVIYDNIGETQQIYLRESTTIFRGYITLYVFLPLTSTENIYCTP